MDDTEKKALEDSVRRAEEAEAALRSVAGAVGEFADADGKNIVEKIAFLRKDYEERLAEKEGQLCRARDYLLTIKSSMENVAGAFIGYIDVDAMINGLNESAPCPHEEEAKRLREERNLSIEGEYERAIKMDCLRCAIEYSMKGREDDEVCIMGKWTTLEEEVHRIADDPELRRRAALKAHGEG